MRRDEMSYARMHQIKRAKWDMRRMRDPRRATRDAKLMQKTRTDDDDDGTGSDARRMMTQNTKTNLGGRGPEKTQVRVEVWDGVGARGGGYPRAN